MKIKYRKNSSSKILLYYIAQYIATRRIFGIFILFFTIDGRSADQEVISNGIRVVAETPYRNVLGYAIYDLVVTAYDVNNGRRIGGFSQEGGYLGGATKQVWTQVYVSGSGPGSSSLFTVEASLQTSNPPSYSYKTYAWVSNDGLSWKSIPPVDGPGVLRFSDIYYSSESLLNPGSLTTVNAVIERVGGSKGEVSVEIRGSYAGGLGFLDPRGRYTLADGVRERVVPVRASYIPEGVERNRGMLLTMGSSIGAPIGVPSAATVTITGRPPTITSLSPDNSPLVGESVRLSVSATGGALTYQWIKDGNIVSGATNSAYSIVSAKAADGGTYSVRVSNANTSVLSRPVNVAVRDLVSGRLANLSVRAVAGAGDRTLIIGFSLTGDGMKPLLLRAVGPGLRAFGVDGAISDPKLGLFLGNAEISSNDNWSTADGREFGAFDLAVGSKDAVLSSALDARSFTAQVTDANGGSGEALVEVYDGAASNATLRLSNLSVRAQLDANRRLIVGMSVFGTQPRTFILRGIGPALSALGVSSAHPDPRIELYSGVTKIAENDQWSDDDGRSSGAFALTTGSRDAVLVRSLAPGNYTLHVLGSSVTAGVVLVEVYESK